MIKMGGLASDGHYYQRDMSPGAYYGAASCGLALGGAAQAAALPETVTAEQLDHLLAGRSADGRRELLHTHRKRKKGWELHGAPDKSVSVLFATASPIIALAILIASEAALRKALEEAEKTCGITRRGKGGKHHELGKLIFVVYTHTTSRNGDPQLHHHVAIVNAVLRQDQTWGALHNRLFYKSQRRLTQTYNRALRDNLVSLGIQAVLQDGRCVVPSVPKELCQAFSTRRKEVVKAKEKFHAKDKEAAQKAAWGTRKKKSQTPEAEQRARWREVAKAHGYDPKVSLAYAPTREMIEAVRVAAESRYPGPRTAPTAQTPVASTATPKPRLETTPSKTATPHAAPTAKPNAPKGDPIREVIEPTRISAQTPPLGPLTAPASQTPSAPTATPKPRAEATSAKTTTPHAAPQAQPNASNSVPARGVSEPARIPAQSQPPGPRVKPAAATEAPPATRKPRDEATQSKVVTPHGAKHVQSTAPPAVTQATQSTKATPQAVAGTPPRQPSEPQSQTSEQTAQAAKPAKKKLTKPKRAADREALRELPLFRRTPERLAERAVGRAIKNLATTFSYFTIEQIEARANELLKTWERHGVGVEPETAKARAEVLTRLLVQPKDFGLEALPRDRGFVTPRQLKLEQSVDRDLKSLADGKAIKPPSPTTIRKAIRRPLTPEQTEAVKGILGSRSQLSLLDGTGRSGKTMMAKEICEAFTFAGRKVYALGGTAQGATAIVSDSTSRPMTPNFFNVQNRRPGVIQTWKLVYQALLKKQFTSLKQLTKYAEAVHRQAKKPPIILDRRSVVVIDDAHRVSTADLAPILKRARKAKAKVILIGDSQGLLPARPSGAFTHAVRKHPATATPPTQFFTDETTRQVLEHLAERNGLAALTTLEARGKLTKAEKPRAQMLTDYCRQGGLESPEKTVILTATEQESRSVNEAVQRLRKAAGHLRTRVKGDGCHVYVGDRVEITKSDRRRGITAHCLGTLVSAGPIHHRVRLDTGKIVTVSRRKSPLRTAYALGPTAAAGHSFERAFVLLTRRKRELEQQSRLPNRNHALAMFGRVNGETRVFAQSQDVEHGHLMKALSRNRPSEMAIDIVAAQQLRQAAQRQDQYQRLGY